MTFGPAVRYPAGPITPYGAILTLSDRIPLVALRSYDDSVVFNLMGGSAVCDPLVPERVELEDLRGLVGPWKTIDQKGASQDGITFVDALYDPMEPELDVRCVGRDPAHLRQVVRDLVASIDIKQEAELSWFTHYLGRWWTKVRWFKPFDEALASIPVCTQNLTLRLRNDTGFWESYPHVDQFRFSYNDLIEPFDFFTAPGDPITGWTLVYSGAGSGSAYTDGAQAVSSFTGARTVVARNTSYTASTDNVVVEVELGTNIQSIFPANTFFDVWARMNNTGTAGTDGVRFRVGTHSVRLSSFSGGVETLIRSIPAFFVPPRPGEKFTFIFGQEGEPRTFKIMRNKATFMTAKENGTTSIVDASHRKAGWGMSVSSGTVRPIALRNWRIGINTTILQEGFVERVNVGDQPMWDRFTCFGPGIFYFGNGPSSSEMVKFGPLLPNQIMQVDTNPGHRGVVDMTAIPPTPQEIALFDKSKFDFFSFLTQSNVTLSQATESIFGIVPPQGNPYSLLEGRFSRSIPPKSPGNPAQSYFVKVKIDEGNSDSQILAAGTPLRRLPY